MSVENKLAEAALLIKEAAELLEKAGLDLDFEIKIKAQRPFFTLNTITDPGENDPPPK